MSLMELKSTSQTRLVKNKYKIDTEPFRMSEYEWRGTLNNSELVLIIKYNLGAWKVKYAETEYDLNNVSYIYAAQETSPMKAIVNKNISINYFIEYIGWNK